MKLTAQVQLLPGKGQHVLLKQTLERCNAVSEYAWQEKEFNAFEVGQVVKKIGSGVNDSRPKFLGYWPM